MVQSDKPQVTIVGGGAVKINPPLVIDEETLWESLEAIDAIAAEL